MTPTIRRLFAAVLLSGGLAVPAVTQPSYPRDPLAPMPVSAPSALNDRLLGLGRSPAVDSET